MLKGKGCCGAHNGAGSGWHAVGLPETARVRRTQEVNAKHSHRAKKIKNIFYDRARSPTTIIVGLGWCFEGADSFSSKGNPSGG